jgi:hypothetical protein
MAAMLGAYELAVNNSPGTVYLPGAMHFPSPVPAATMPIVHGAAYFGCNAAKSGSGYCGLAVDSGMRRSDPTPQAPDMRAVGASLTRL